MVKCIQGISSCLYRAKCVIKHSSLCGSATKFQQNQSIFFVKIIMTCILKRYHIINKTCLVWSYSILYCIRNSIDINTYILKSVFINMPYIEILFQQSYMLLGKRLSFLYINLITRAALNHISHQSFVVIIESIRKLHHLQCIGRIGNLVSQPVLLNRKSTEFILHLIKLEISQNILGIMLSLCIMPWILTVCRQPCIHISSHSRLKIQCINVINQLPLTLNFLRKVFV